jgi:purine-binding chemotaxis protein CheW
MPGGDESEVRVSGARELLVLRAGGQEFAVYADEAEGVSPWVAPAPLPHAPAAVLGVVSVRGRMRTVLDPSALFGPRAAEPFRLIVALRGDEQLALAAADAERVSAAAHEPAAPPDPASTFLRGDLRHEGRPLHLLDPARLFDAAMAGSERRRRRG